MGTAVRAGFVAILLALIGLPADQTWKPLLRRHWSQKGRLIVFGVFATWMFFIFKFWLGLTIVADGLAVAEMLDRDPEVFGRRLLSIFAPALYLFIGIVIVFSFNHAIAGMKWAGSYDQFFNGVDLAIFRTSVSGLAHAALHLLPPWSYKVFEVAYYSLYGQIGATLILTALLSGRAFSIRYVGALLVGYYIALLIFFLWPTIGPFAICKIHISDYPNSLPTFWTQESILAKARLLWLHNPVPEAYRVDVADYYIGFPCMHVALPLISIWFLRKWRRVIMILAAFDVLLVVSILLLEWHYIIDLFAGVLVAALAVAAEASFRKILGSRS
jgi:PAP2 superfamily